MVGQQQGPNQIESPANLLQQPHNYDVQVSRFWKYYTKVQTSNFNSDANNIYAKFVITNIDSCELVCTSDIIPSSTYLEYIFFYSSTKLKYNPFRVTQYILCWSFFPPLNSFQFVFCLFARHLI